MKYFYIFLLLSSLLYLSANVAIADVADTELANTQVSLTSSQQVLATENSLSYAALWLHWLLAGFVGSGITWLMMFFLQQRKASLQHDTNQYRAIFNHASIGIALIDRDGRYLKTNTYYQKLFNYTATEIQQMRCFDMTTSEYLELSRNRLNRLFQGAIDYHQSDKAFVRKNGSIFWGSHWLAAVKNEQGDCEKVICIISDFTAKKQIEENLRNSQQRLSTLIEALPDGVFFKDNAGRWQLINAAAIRLFKLQDVDWQGKTDTELSELQPHFRDSYKFSAYGDELAWKQGSQLHAEEIVRDEQGSPHYFDVTKVPLFTLTGERSALVIIFHDVTDRKRSEWHMMESRRHLLENRKRLQFALEAAQAGAFYYDVENDRLDWDFRCLEIFGLTPERFKANRSAWFDPVFPEDRGAVEWAVRTATQHGKHFDIEFRILQPSGETRHIRSQGYMVANHTGETQAIAGLYFDISHQKKLETARQVALDLTQAVLDNALVGIGFINHERRFQHINRLLAEIFGYTPEELLGQTTECLYPSAEAYHVLAHAAYPILQHGGIYETELQMKRKNGQLFWCRMRGQRMRIEDLSQGFIWSMEDVSERHAYEAELTQAKQKAETANQAKSMFLANMSHELRTPLNAILGFAQLLVRDSSLTTEQHSKLATINRSGEHLLELINDVLDMSKIEAGRNTLKLKRFDLPELVQGIVEIFQVRAEHKGLYLRLELDTNLPHYIKTDSRKLRQILFNLLGNAIKFTEQGGVILSIRAGEEPDAPAVFHLFFEIKDTGPGLSAQEQKQLFKPFVQTHSGQNKEQGTGLGLTISRHFARLLGGDIHVQSEQGNGATFYFELQIEITDEQHDFKAIKPAKQLITQQEKNRILIVEDQESSRILLRNILKQTDFSIQEAQNGKEALEKWQQWHPHLIFMDLHMPEMDGYTATQKIKQQMIGEPTIIIALTANAFTEYREKAIAAGCDDFISKPFRIEEIFQAITRFLGVSHQAATDLSHISKLSPAVGKQPEAKDLSMLPTELQIRLKQAVTLGNSEQLDGILTEIAQHDAPLAKTLQQWAVAYEYERILKWIAL
ncbi:PAS domain-containing hybrid sensor histidine kinase/response regulator [Candidatus Venteria ishoeyi]|uniref:histidine kinase n=1 Tax=Candidatus Venteria ishoeyi TaxID=1899563 RepID=A0A1H6FGN4_9GAMM|nr:PAS domain S-box protein [Candidatus Venteria ishoeyi]SEH09197.1 Sensor protein EvgS precursor [Candidatus Venteria ishoeyi]SEH09322.1 Sensor protein EvgS precursor [Candidatus Venteria ishoeyi]